MDTVTLRRAHLEDAEAILEIYAPYIRNTNITFEYEVPSLSEFRDRMAGIMEGYPYLICEIDGIAAGYAYAHRYKERAAYQWSAELSIYLGRDSTGRGLGRRLYGALMELLRLQGVRTVYGCVTLPNAGSEGLHAAMGFRLTGTWHRAGFKCGAWRDVGWFEKTIAPYDPSPAPVRPIGEVPAAVAAEILERYSR